MTVERANPFSDLGDFAPKPAASKPVQPAQIEQLARDNDFPSRQPAKAAKPAPATLNAAAERPRRRYTTGRNQQINVKATAETISRFYKLADERGVPLGELLDQALTALEQAGRS